MKRHLHLSNRPRHFKALLVAVGFVAFLLGSCVGSHPVDEPSSLPWAARSVAVDSLRDTTSVLLKTTNTNQIGSFSKPGLLSGIGRVFSTPEGIARRQQLRLAKAAVPRSIGKGAVYAPLATEVVNAYKPRAAVIKADSGAIVTAIDKNKGAAATAPNATATQTIQKPGFPWGRIGLALGGVGLLVLLLGTPVGGWALAAFKRRSSNNQA